MFGQCVPSGHSPFWRARFPLCSLSMSEQVTFADAVYASTRRVTRREPFLTEMDQAIPWATVEALVEHPFLVFKRLEGFTKVRSRGLAKDTTRVLPRSQMSAFPTPPVVCTRSAFPQEEDT